MTRRRHPSRGRGSETRCCLGLVDDEEQVKSRYGDGVTAKLDGDVDDLELRVAALEDELRQARRTS
jgi:hypothetical protein